VSRLAAYAAPFELLPKIERFRAAFEPIYQDFLSLSNSNAYTATPDPPVSNAR
jgi:hypothetical protein